MIVGCLKDNGSYGASKPTCPPPNYQHGSPLIAPKQSLGERAGRWPLDWCEDFSCGREELAGRASRPGSFEVNPMSGTVYCGLVSLNVQLSLRTPALLSHLLRLSH